MYPKSFLTRMKHCPLYLLVNFFCVTCIFLSPCCFLIEITITFSTKAATDKSVVLELTWPKPSNKGNYQVITSA